MFQLNGKIAVVTGGGSGIGKAVALLFARQGAEVNVIDLNEEACIATINEIKINNGLSNVHSRDPNLKYSNILDKLYTRQVTFTINIQE